MTWNHENDHNLAMFDNIINRRYGQICGMKSSNRETGDHDGNGRTYCAASIKHGNGSVVNSNFRFGYDNFDLGNGVSLDLIYSAEINMLDFCNDIGASVEMYLYLLYENSQLIVDYTFSEDENERKSILALLELQNETY